MNLSLAIVGLPNVGKSTLFNALLKQQVALAANYPFATIEPNVGVVAVPDARLPILAGIVQTKKMVPAVVTFVDVAGLVKGASKGEGLGNQFLAHIRETTALCHVLRGFADSDVIREGSVDPVTDLETIRLELQLADLATLEKQRPPKGSSDAKEKARWQSISTFLTAVQSGKSVRDCLNTPEEAALAKELSLLTAKPEIMVVNVCEADVGNAALAVEHARQLSVPVERVILVSAKIENELAALSEEDQQAYLHDLGLQESGLDRLSKTAYHVLGLQSFLTAGELEARAWTIRKGATAVEAAGEIHTDFMKKFIKAQVTDYQDFVTYTGWKGVREAGKLRVEGRDYIMRDGDVVEFMIGS